MMFPYSLRTNLYFSSGKICATKYGIKTPSCVGPKLWNLVPSKYKTIASLADFKVKKKTESQRIVLTVMQNMCSTNQFCLIFPHDNS